VSSVEASSETTGREKDYVGAAILIWEYNRELWLHGHGGGRYIFDCVR
jgi:hypothetical protein